MLILKILEKKEIKPTKIDLSKIPSSSLDNEEVDEEYRPYLKQTTLNVAVSSLNKEMFLKHKRRRTSISKPTGKGFVSNLYNEYQDVFANVNLSTIEKYWNMLKYKETISN